MNQKANQLARLIRAKHQKKSQKEIKPDTLIGLCLRCSPELIISMLAVLKAGGAYVPLDPDYPAERLEYMIEDSHESLIITQEEFIQNQFLSQLHQNELLVIDSEEVKALLKEEDVENLTPISGVNDLDYVIYTSGSTGKPKGVMVEHRAVCSFSVNANYIQIKESDRVAQLASMAFDAIVFEVWSSLVNGAEVILFGKNEFLNVVQLKQSIKKYKINILFLTTALFNTIIDQYPEILFPLKTVLFGCEAVNVNKVNNFLKKNSEVQLIHVYGPTEATTFSTYYLVDMKCHTYNYLPIGRATSNKFLYVLDSHLNLVPLGVVGELYIGGPGLARGYLKEETLSKERFIMNPFSKELSLPEADKIYKTGDLVRWLPDGNIEYLGRADFQVKIRGFRVELGEIENILVGHKSLSQVCVLTHGKDERKYLAAYYVLEKNKTEPDITELRNYTSKYLPEYMIPSFYIKLNKMPLTPNGKINRKALPKPKISKKLKEYVVPRSEIEKKLSKIWSDILKIKKISIYDNFFHLGGHSLLAIQLVSRIHSILRCDISIKAVFDNPSLVDLSRFVEAELKIRKGKIYRPIMPIRRSKKGHFLSSEQERLWFLDQFEGPSPHYNIPVCLSLKGKLNLMALKSSIQQLVDRHEPFRTIFVKNKKNICVQKILNQLKIDLTCEVLKNKELKNAIYEEIHKPFDLEKGPLIRVRLFEEENEKYILIFNHHHIISDGWSVDIILNELSEFYQAHQENRKPHLKPLPIQYIDFAAWQRNEFKKPLFQEKLNFWKRYLSGYTELQLPTDYSRPPEFSYKGGHFYFNLDDTLSNKLVQLAKANGTTLYIVLLTAFNILLSRYSAQTDIIIGSPTANRYHSSMENLMGFFVNTLVLRNQIDGHLSVKELLNQVTSRTLDVFGNQEVPFERVVETVDVQRDPSRHPIIQVMFSLQSFGTDITGESTLRLPGVKVSPYVDINYDVAKFDLTLFMEEQILGLIGHFEYCTDLFHPKTIERMASHFEHLLQSLVGDSYKKVNDLELLTEAKRQQLLINWNDTTVDYPKDKNITQLFEAQVEKTPNRIAVVFENQTLTYQALNIKSNQLAYLICIQYKKQNKKDLKPDTLIGLCTRRSLDMIVALLAILKAGAAYVPLDPDYPKNRLEFMIQDSHEGLIVTQKNIVSENHFLKQLHTHELLILDSDEVKTDLSNQTTENLALISGPRNLAYVIYTSGTTGKPKGVMVEHKSINSLVVNNAYLHMSERDALLSLSSLVFDASTFEIWMPLLNGSKLVLAKDTKELTSHLEQFKKVIIQHQITTLWLTKTLFDSLYIQDKYLFSGLKTLLVGGEALNIDLINQLISKNQRPCRVLNGYGPTEGTTFTTIYECQKNIEGNSVPIGRPISQRKVFILDANLNPVPVGVTGELYIGGAGVARGYLNRPELTKEHFIPNPFAKELDLPSSDRIYKTGDLASWLPDGNLEYLGRMDFQVKIRGFRIELGEIENVLTKHKYISQVCVVALGEEQKYLAAYYVVEKNQPEPRSGDLLGYLSQYLPDYMIPNAFVPLDKMPLTPSGKIDRKALPEPERHLMGEEYVAPRNEIEQELATIWCQILKLDCVGIHDDFFHLGGHSILTISLISNINQIFKLSLAVAWSFEYTTIAEQAYFILRENPSLKEYKFIIKISSPNGLIPLFLIPPAGGGAEVYLSMGKLFNTKDSLISAIYAIESYNLYHLDKPIESLKLLANKYIKYIKTIQPKGPYFLGGWSLGGTIAYEIANQLKNRGELILGVYIIDTKAIDPAVWEKIEVLKTPNNFRKNLKVLGISDAEIPQLLKLNSIEEKLLLTYTLPKSKDIAIILMQALKFETSSDKRG